jgi:hypothetical protein
VLLDLRDARITPARLSEVTDLRVVEVENTVCQILRTEAETHVRVLTKSDFRGLAKEIGASVPAWLESCDEGLAYLNEYGNEVSILGGNAEAANFADGHVRNGSLEVTSEYSGSRIKTMLK